MSFIFVNQNGFYCFHWNLCCCTFLAQCVLMNSCSMCQITVADRGELMDPPFLNFWPLSPWTGNSRNNKKLQKNEIKKQTNKKNTHTHTRIHTHELCGGSFRRVQNCKTVTKPFPGAEVRLCSSGLSPHADPSLHTVYVTWMCEHMCALHYRFLCSSSGHFYNYYYYFSSDSLVKTHSTPDDLKRTAFRKS